MIYIGIDNGVTGTIGVLDDEGSYFLKTPVKKEQNYTKKAANITRVDFRKFSDFIFDFTIIRGLCKISIERPMVNPGRFKATISAIRALEAVSCALDDREAEYSFIDSKEWQKALLPNIIGSDGLKDASKELGIKLYPQHAELIEKHGDADGLLIAHYLKTKHEKT